MSFSSSDDDSQQRFALGFLLILITLVVATVVGAVVVKRGPGAASKAPQAVVVQAAPIEEVASVRVENGMVLFFFANAKAELATGTNEALTEIVKGVADGKKAVVSGFHDASGDAALNEELAKQRALAVRDALLALGVADEKIELKKPELTVGAGEAVLARRVEVVLAP